LSNKIEWLGDVTGTRLRKLPISSTCSLVLMLHDTYEDNDESQMAFESDLDTGFFNSDGFDERLYRDSYRRSHFAVSSHAEFIDLTSDMHEHNNDGNSRNNEPLNMDNNMTDDNRLIRGGSTRRGGDNDGGTSTASNSRRGNDSESNTGRNNRRGGNRRSTRRGGNGGDSTAGSSRNLRSRNLNV
jgi:hypothetical protein